MSSLGSEETSELEAQDGSPVEDGEQPDVPRSKPSSFMARAIGGIIVCACAGVVLVVVMVCVSIAWSPFGLDFLCGGVALDWLLAGLFVAPFLGWGLYLRSIARGRAQAWGAYSYILFAIVLPLLLWANGAMDGSGAFSAFGD